MLTPVSESEENARRASDLIAQLRQLIDVHRDDSRALYFIAQSATENDIHANVNPPLSRVLRWLYRIEAYTVIVCSSIGPDLTAMLEPFSEVDIGLGLEGMLSSVPTQEALWVSPDSTRGESAESSPVIQRQAQAQTQTRKMQF